MFPAFLSFKGSHSTWMCSRITGKVASAQIHMDGNRVYQDLGSGIGGVLRLLVISAAHAT
jgi:hypothetical protein